MPLADLFPPGGYRFHLTLARSGAAQFFGGTKDGPALLAERARWLRESPVDYCLAQDVAAPALAEIAAMAREWGVVAPPGDAPATCRALGLAIEPDFAVLVPGADGAFRIAAGCVCFPTVWALEEKLGATLAETHGPVPGLNAAIGRQIDAFLAKLRPGPAWLRANWGLSASPELNQHPALRPPAIAVPPDPARIWLRVERQALVALPASGGVLFGIRIENHPLTAVLAEPEAAAGLRDALATMPEEMARYKRLADVRDGLVALLRGG